MYLAPEGAETDVADGASKFLASEMPIARLHQPASADLSVALRQSLGEMGWFGLGLPETNGGSGLSAVEQALFFREVGRQCGPLDILAQSLAAMVVEDDLRTQLTSGMEGVALLASDGSGFRCFGSPAARYAVHVTRKGSHLYGLQSPEIVVRPALDPSNSLCALPKAPSELIARSDDPNVHRTGQLACAAMLLGVAEASVDLIVAYAKVRETFGRKIGSYQAVRHPCADMALRVEASRSQLWFAAAAIKEGRSDADTHLDAAKHLANEAAVLNCDVNIQLHGGIGITDEHDAHLLLKRALVLSRLFGAKRELLTRLLTAKVLD